MLMLAYEVNTDPPQLFNREVQNVVKVNNVYVGRRQPASEKASLKVRAKAFKLL